MARLTRRSPERPAAEDAAVAALSDSSVAAAVVHLPDLKVLELSRAARQLLFLGDDDADPTIGDLIVGEPSEVLQTLLRDGTLRGFETTHVVRTRAGNVPMRAWVHTLSRATPELAIVAFDPIHVDGSGRPPLLTDENAPPVVGTADSMLRVDRISSEADTALGYPSEDVIGRSLLQLIAPGGIGSFMWALGEATAHRRGTVVRLPVLQADGTESWRCMDIIPLVPPPSLAFAFMGDCPDGTDANLAGRVLTHMARGVRATGTLRRAAGEVAPDSPLAKLSPRELEVAFRISSGDRVPAIAAAMFISQSTVRNYLSSLFRKLNLKSQQELVEFMRSQQAHEEPAHEGRRR